MAVTTTDVDTYSPGRGQDRSYWLNYLLKLMVGGLVFDGDKGGVTVSGSGTVWTVNYANILMMSGS